MRISFEVVGKLVMRIVPQKFSRTEVNALCTSTSGSNSPSLRLRASPARIIASPVPDQDCKISPSHSEVAHSSIPLYRWLPSRSFKFAIRQGIISILTCPSLPGDLSRIPPLQRRLRFWDESNGGATAPTVS